MGDWGENLNAGPRTIDGRVVLYAIIAWMMTGVAMGATFTAGNLLQLFIAGIVAAGFAFLGVILLLYGLLGFSFGRDGGVT